jgi:hypothetical protein
MEAGTPRAEICKLTGLLTTGFDSRRDCLCRRDPTLRGRLAEQSKARKANRSKPKVAKPKVAKLKLSIGVIIEVELPAEKLKVTYGPAPDYVPNPKYEDLSDAAIESWPWATMRWVAKPAGVDRCCWPLGAPGEPYFKFCDSQLSRHHTYCDGHADVGIARQQQPVRRALVRA